MMMSAIYVPFTGIPEHISQSFSTREEKLNTIISNLDKHHDAVRRNMLLLFHTQRVQILKEAEEAISQRLPSDAHQFNDETENSIIESEAEQLLAKLRAVVPAGANPDKYEIKEVPTLLRDILASDRASIQRGEHKAPLRDLTTIDAIREETSWRLHSLMQQSSQELEAQEKRSREARKYYEDALERGKRQEGNKPSESERRVSRDKVVVGTSPAFQNAMLPPPARLEVGKSTVDPWRDPRRR